MLYAYVTDLIVAVTRLLRRGVDKLVITTRGAIEGIEPWDEG